MSKLTRDENGIGQVLIIVLIVIVLAVAGGVVWKLTKKNSNTNTSSTTTSATASKPAISSACLKSFNDNSLCAFAEHTNINSQQYVATGTATTATGATSTFTVQNDGKGNTEVAYGSSGKQISSISLDGVTYIQEGAGTTWLEYSSASLGQAAAAPNPTSGFNLNFTTTTPAGVTVTKQGTAACGALSCNKYKVVVAATPGATQYVYFDSKDYMLRQWTSSDPSTGINVNLTFSYPSVTITKPSPVQQI